MTRTRWRAIVIAGCSGLLTGPAPGSELPDHVNGPLSGMFGFPDSTEGAHLQPAGTHGITLSATTASHNVEDLDGTEQLRLDGETTRVALTWRYGVSGRLELGAEIPYLWHQSGRLDNLIDGWHDVFNLPAGARAGRAQNQLEFYYTDAAGNAVNLTRNVRGIGDLRLLAGWELSRRERSRIALRVGIKLPSGDSERLTGSGGTDISIGIAGDSNPLWHTGALSGFYRADIIHVGTPDVLGGRHRALVGQIAGGFGYRIGRRFEFQLQARMRSAVYHSAINNMGRMSAVLTTGAEVRVSDRYGVFFAVGEDVKPESAPDVSFQLGFRTLGR